MRVYADSSALVKLLIAESETEVLQSYLASASELVTSRLAEVEIGRAVGRHPLRDSVRLAELLDRLSVRELTADIAQVARTLGPPELRSLDAIHLATALELRADLDAFVSYDDRQIAAARVLGLPVAVPGE